MTDLFFSALAFAARKHRDQRRKDAARSPYINHCIDVARLLAETGGVDDEVLLAAAILHDTVEDTSATLDDLDTRFGPEVARIVAAVSDDKNLPKAERKRLQIEKAPTLPEPARVLKIADKISNVRDVVENPPSDWSEERRFAYIEWAQRVVDGCRGVNTRLEREFDALIGSAAERFSR